MNPVGADDQLRFDGMVIHHLQLATVRADVEARHACGTVHAHRLERFPGGRLDQRVLEDMA